MNPLCSTFESFYSSEKKVLMPVTTSFQRNNINNFPIIKKNKLKNRRK